MKRLRRMPEAQCMILDMLNQANGKVVKLKPTKSMQALIKRKYVVATKTGFKLHPKHISRPTWVVVADWRGLDWQLSNALIKAVPNSTGSGYDFWLERYDVSWHKYTRKQAEIVLSKIKAFKEKKQIRKIRIKIYNPSSLKARVS